MHLYFKGFGSNLEFKIIKFEDPVLTMVLKLSEKTSSELVFKISVPTPGYKNVTKMLKLYILNMGAIKMGIGNINNFKHLFQNTTNIKIKLITTKKSINLQLLKLLSSCKVNLKKIS